MADAIEDRDFGPIWAHHFPMRRESPASRMLLIILVGIVKDRIIINSPRRNFADRLPQYLERYEIPKAEFDVIEREM